VTTPALATAATFRCDGIAHCTGQLNGANVPAERGFTPAQLAAVTAADGPLGIIAGPGTGKTTVLAGRVAHLVRARGADPASVLVVTFTADAARALRSQVGHELGSAASDLAIHTLHAFGRKVVTTWSSQFGFDSYPTVLPADEGRALLASVAGDQGWDLTAFPLADLAAAVDRCRLQADPVARRADPLADLADAFQQRLRRRNALDFASMVALPLQLFREDERALRVLQDAFRWLVVDEVQDLDATQVALLQLLAAQHRNLVVAGDPAQSIYAFRGADTRFLLSFEQAFPGACRVSLDHNFRASGGLVELANALNELLAYRPAQVTDNPVGPPACLYVADDEQAEAAFIANQIGLLVDRGLLPHPGQAAVLYRTNGQADRLAAALREAGVPYARHGHSDLFSTRVVRDALAYLRLARDPDDRMAVTRVINVPPRGLSRLAAALVDQPAITAALPARVAEIDLKEASVSAAATFVALVYDLHALAHRGLSPAALLERALERSGYLAWLEHHPDGMERQRVLDRLRAVARRADVALGEWLDGLALGENVDPAPDAEATRLSSIHHAKGSEWRATFLPGLEEGILPHYRALGGDGSGQSEAVIEEALREELRVGYVALTRPRERLYLSYCRARERGGRIEARQPSRWLYALPPELLAGA
jgi:DNA helicase-2/ATP-dependent DNA helicase PcrA